MALDIKLNITTSKDCKDLLITDMTGIFNAQGNPTGWKGTGSLSSSLEMFKIVLLITPYFEASNGNVAFPTISYTSDIENPRWKFPTNTLERFIFSVPSSEMLTDIQTSLSEDGGPYNMSDLVQLTSGVVPDLVYNITVHIIGVNDPTSLYSKSICFTNVCTIKKAVTKLFTNVNFECEDCDDSDLESALLAKNLLETLEESCNL